jgi:hypothetical protein
MATESDQWGVWDVAGNTRTLVEPSQAWYDAREPEPEPTPDPLGDIAAELPAATLEEVNDLLAQVLSTLGGN